MTTHDYDFEALGVEALPAGFAEIMFALQPASATGTLLPETPAEPTSGYRGAHQQTTGNAS